MTNETKYTPGPVDICDSANSNLVHLETGEGNPEGQGVQIATFNKGDHEQRIVNATIRRPLLELS